MKAVIGLFRNVDHVKSAMDDLRQGGYGADRLAMITPQNANEINELIEEHGEETTGKGAALGAGMGGALGMAASLAVAPIPGFNFVVWTVALGTVSSAVLGGYFGALLSSRASQRPEFSYREGLADGESLLIAQVNAADSELAEEIMRRAGGEDIYSYDIDADEFNKLSQATPS